MATSGDQNLEREVLTKENSLKGMELDYWNQYTIITPFMMNREVTWKIKCFCSTWNLSIVFKSEHTSYFTYWKCTVTTENASFPVDRCHKSAHRGLKIIGTWKSNCLMLMKASGMCSASSILPLKNINSRRNIMSEYSWNPYWETNAVVKRAWALG